MIMISQQWKQISPDDVIGKVGRHVTDFQWSIARTIVAMRLNLGLQWRGKSIVPARVFLCQRCWRLVRVVMHRPQEIGLSDFKMRLEDYRVSVTLDRLRNVPLVLAGVSKIHVSLNQIRLDSQGRLQRLHGLVQPAKL